MYFSPTQIAEIFATILKYFIYSIQYHKDSPDDLSSLRITFLDLTDDPGPREEDFPNLKRLETPVPSTYEFIELVPS